MEPIGIINYGYGNIFSVINSLDYLDIKYKIIDKPEHINEFHNVILPGVGSFGNVMRKLNELNFNNALKEYVQIDKNLLLGICVGMQVLFNESEESENIKGLDLLEGSVKKLKKIEDNYIDRIPNIGWRNNYQFTTNVTIRDAIEYAEQGLDFGWRGVFMIMPTEKEDILNHVLWEKYILLMLEIVPVRND